MTAARPDFNVNDAISNVMTAALQATNYDIRIGSEWYYDCRAEAIEIANDFGVPFHTVAAITAIYSAFMPWERNVKATMLTIEQWAMGIPFATMKCPVMNSKQMRKAIDILNGAHPFDTIADYGTDGSRAWKTKCFYMNIVGMSRRRVTVDVWMWRLITGNWETKYRPSGREYVAAERVFRMVADELNYQPMDLQAIVWVMATGKAA